jgi:hypothetical protein
MRDEIPKDRLDGVDRVAGDDRVTKFVTELWDRCEHATDELDRPLEQLGVLAHRDDPSARNSNQARRVRPLDQQGQAVQLGAALDREALIENVAGIQHLHQRERVPTSQPTGLRQRTASADPLHQSAHPGDRRRADSDRRQIVTCDQLVPPQLAQAHGREPARFRGRGARHHRRSTPVPSIPAAGGRCPERDLALPAGRAAPTIPPARGSAPQRRARADPRGLLAHRQCRR